ncbi:MAG: MauE/DoxX family redox-associated membrane protein [Rubrobacteraceae bacterium]
MDIVILFARLLLVGVFVVAGIAKLSDREGSRKAVAGFGVPPYLAAPIGILLPLAELVVAVALIPAATALWGAVGALALLLLFVAGIGANLARGRRPDCHCFGQLHSSPAGWSTLARNGVLAAIAAFVVWQGLEGEVGPSVIGWLAALSTTQLLIVVGGTVVLALVAVQWFFLFGVLRQNGRLLARLNALENRLAAAGLAPSGNGAHQTSGLPVGSPAPAFTLDGLDGEKVALDGLRARGKPVMLMFTDPDCEACMELLPDVGRWQQQYGGKLTIAVVGLGSVEENSAEASEHGLDKVLLQEDWEVADAYEVDVTPGAVVVSPEGIISSPVAEGPEEVAALLAYAVGERAQLPLFQSADHAAHDKEDDEPEGPEVGEPAPEISLQDLEGRDVSLEDFRGEEVLVLFCSPGCGFCQEMMPDIKQWEAAPPEGAPRLLVVSDETVEENKAIGLSSPVVLDNTDAVWDAYDVSGTPSAVLVDADGRIASRMAVGSEEVLELIKSGRTAA